MDKKSFQENVERAAEQAIKNRMSTEAGKKAIAAVAIAFRTLAAKNQDIYGCTLQSVAECVVRAASLQLYPGGFMPGADLFVQKGREKVNGQWGEKPFGKWTLEYRPNATGLRALVRRTLGVEITPMVVVREDKFEWEEGLSRFIKHFPNPDVEEITEDNFRFGYTTWTDKDGNQNFTVVRKGDIMRARAASQSFKTWQDKKRKNETYNPEPTWVNAFHPMVLKTLVLWTIRHCLPVDLSKVEEISDAIDSAEDATPTVAVKEEVVVEKKEEKKPATSKDQDRELLAKKEVIPESRQIEAASELEVSMEEAQAKEPEKVEVVEVQGIRKPEVVKAEVVKEEARETVKAKPTGPNDVLREEIKALILEVGDSATAEIKKDMGISGPGKMAFALYPDFLRRLRERADAMKAPPVVAEEPPVPEDPGSFDENSDDMP